MGERRKKMGLPGKLKERYNPEKLEAGGRKHKKIS